MLTYLVHLASRLGAWGYAIVGLGAMLESAAFVGLIIPGETLVLIAGFLAGQHVFDVDALIVSAALGAIAGDNIGYALGRHLGRRWAVRYGARFGVTPERLERVDVFFRRHGGKSVFVGRFVSFGRALVPFIAGSARMRRPVFLLYNAAGGAVWASLFVLLGYFVGEAARLWVGRASAVLGIILFVVLLGFVAWHWLATHENAVRAARRRFSQQPRVRALERRFAPQLAWLRRRLRPGGYLGLQLTLGLALFAAGAWLFGGITEDVVTGDPLTAFDRRIAVWFNAHQNPHVTTFMLWVSRLHTWPYVTAVVAAFLGYLAWRHRRKWIVFVLVAVPGGLLLNTIVKLAVHRARPMLSGLAAQLHTYSFPSGHTAAATLLWGTFAMFLIPRVRAWRWKALVAIVAVILVLLVAQSRVYLGVHYVSDVIGAAVEESAWLALTYTGVNTYWQQRKRKATRQ